jgi:hypothetical protein
VAREIGTPLVQREPLPLEPVRVIGVPVGAVPRAVAVLGAVRLAALVSFEPKNAARESVSLGVRSQHDCALPNRHCELVGRVTARSSHHDCVVYERVGAERWQFAAPPRRPAAWLDI